MHLEFWITCTPLWLWFCFIFVHKKSERKTENTILYLTLVIEQWTIKQYCICGCILGFNMLLFLAFSVWIGMGNSPSNSKMDQLTQLCFSVLYCFNCTKNIWKHLRLIQQYINVWMHECVKIKCRKSGSIQLLSCFERKTALGDSNFNFLPSIHGFKMRSASNILILVAVAVASDRDAVIKTSSLCVIMDLGY